MKGPLRIIDSYDPQGGHCWVEAEAELEDEPYGPLVALEIRGDSIVLLSPLEAIRFGEAVIEMGKVARDAELRREVDQISQPKETE